jgi:chromate transporter
VIGAGVVGYPAAASPWTSSARAAGTARRRGYGPAIIDDGTATPAHARFDGGVCAARDRARDLGTGDGRPRRVRRLGRRAAQMGWFFTKAALLTFGGAYAVLPYVYQAAVENYQWLTAAQMIDGLALGETTPGPLIMVVAFVGFVGGWSQALFGPEQLFLAAAASACVAAFFTFLPSFLFIFAGAPLVEATHGDLKFTAPLTGITAAVVGVILNPRSSLPGTCCAGRRQRAFD